MSTQGHESPTHIPHLDSVSPETIEQFDAMPHDRQDLYKELLHHNEELAKWLRRRAVNLAPDLIEREGQTQLALELAGMILRQENIHVLEELYISKQPADHVLPKQRYIEDSLFDEAEA